ncbi:hypothetical protein LLT3_05125 [Lactococcus cremoris subsp. cremoris TIFN3]|uniref:Uncharacterized protein n=1 Tax=Lactococcus cremoris subsp. cremoris TIFN3 TaxID=1234873 RepID=T0WTC3_LACLC|nr:hypothetical protein LLT3_05125 [Lactococcus cremoris subsp. cremoris TIFN3]
MIFYGVQLRQPIKLREHLLKMAKKPVSGIILSVFQARLLKERMGMSLLIIIIAIKKMWL